MKVTHNLRMDLARCSCTPVVNAVQGEGNTRALIISLYDNGAAWEAPAGTTAAVAFKKPDGLCGLYDQLPNGDTAVTIDGSTVTAILAPQALTVPGEVTASVVFYDQDMDRLATFPFRIRVAVDPAGGQHVSNEYYNYSTLEEVNEAIDAALAALEADKQAFLVQAAEALALVHDTATGDAPAIVCEATGATVGFADASDRPLRGLRIYGKTTQDGTPTPEAPAELVSAGASGAINTTVTAKNLLGGNALADKLVELANATKDEANGTVKYAASDIDSKRIFEFPDPNKQYTIIFYGMNTNASNNGVNLAWKYANGTVVSLGGFETKGSLSYAIATSAAGKQAVGLVGYYNSQNTILHYDKCGIFEGVLTEADFEPFVGQTLTASTVHEDGSPNGLPGNPLGATIPDIIKSSDALMAGVWWDEETQQYYISDTKDYARGVYVHRVCPLDLGTLKWTRDGAGYFQTAQSNTLGYIQRIDVTTRPNGMCNRYPIDSIVNAFNYDTDVISWYWVESQSRNIIRVYDFAYTDVISFQQAVAGAIVQFILHEPIETPLSAEELAAYAALHSYKPTTTVYNDAGAGLAVEYVADTKNYIDQKLAAISAAMLNA